MAWFPGETTINNLVDVALRDGLGGWLAPWQQRRLGRARIDVARDEIIRLADAERKAKAILTGEACLENNGEVTFLQPSAQAQQEVSRLKPALRENGSIDLQAIRYQREILNIIEGIKVTKMILQAIDHLEKDKSPKEPEPGKRTIEQDWFNQWRRYASLTDSDDLQGLWSLILAEEAKEPGSSNFRLLNFFSQISGQEAKLIEKMASLICRDNLVFYVRGVNSRIKFVSEDNSDSLLSGYLSPNEISMLRELGIIQEHFGGYVHEFKSDPEIDLRCCIIIGQLGIGFALPKGGSGIEVNYLSLTILGKDVIRFAKVAPNTEYVNQIAKRIEVLGAMSVEVGAATTNPDGSINIGDRVHSPS